MFEFVLGSKSLLGRVEKFHESMTSGRVVLQFYSKFKVGYVRNKAWPSLDINVNVDVRVRTFKSERTAGSNQMIDTFLGLCQPEGTGTMRRQACQIRGLKKY